MESSSPDLNDGGAPSAAQSLRTILRFLSILRRRLGLIVACLLIAAVLGSLYYVTVDRVYEANAALLIEFIGGNDNALGGPLETLSSDKLATYQRLFESDVVLAGAVAQLRRLPPEIDRSQPRERWADMLRKLVSTEKERGANIVVVSCRSSDPEACLDVVNAVVASYLRFMQENQKTVVVEVVTNLDKERANIEVELAERSTELLAAKRECGAIGLVNSDGSQQPVVQRAIRLSQTLLDVQQRRIRLETSLTVIRKAVARDGNFAQHVLELEPIMGRQFVENLLGAKPDELKHLFELKSKKLTGETELANLQLHYLDNHPNILEATDRLRILSANIARLEHQIAGRTTGRLDHHAGEEAINRIEESLASSWQQEAALQQQYVQAEQDAIALNDRLAVVLNIERDLQRLHKQHESLLERLVKIDLNQTQARVRVAPVREPRIPDVPSSPRLKIVVLMTLALGLGSAVVIVYVLDLLDDRFRSPEEIKEQLRVGALVAVRRLQLREGVGLESVQMHLAPDGVESEAFRTLRTTLSFAGEERERLAITSPEPGDGKTTISSNLGVAYAKAGKRTLLIDADMRKPGLSKLFGVRRLAGLSDILRGNEEIAEMASERVVSSGMENLDIIPCGPKPVDPAELLSGPRMEQLIAWAATHYDQVLVDCPPVLAASDAAIVGRLTDGMVLVLQPEKNHRRLVLRAAEDLVSMGVQLAAVVANRIDLAKENGYGYGSGYGYGYGYGYGSGYGAHGYGQDSSEPDDDEAESNLEVELESSHCLAADDVSPERPRRRVA